MESITKQFDEVLSWKHSHWISGFFYGVLLPPFFGWIGQLVFGDIWAGVAICFITLAIVFGVVLLRQRSRHKEMVALKAGQGLCVIRLNELDLSLTPVSHPELPKGLVWLRWVKFFIASSQDNNLAATVASVSPTPANEGGLLDIHVGRDGVSEVYLLVTAGYGVKSAQGAPPGGGWDEKIAGHIELIFGDRSKQEFDLRLGHDIRDFSYGNQPWAIDALRNEGITSFQVWHSSRKECTLDMIVIKVRDRPKQLDKIRIVAQMEEGVGPVVHRKGAKVLHEPAYPAIQVFGVTCRTVEV